MAEKCEAHAQDIARHEAQIKTLFKQQDEMGKLTESVHELALSVKEVVTNMGNIDSRLKSVEEERSSQRKTVRTAVITAAVSAIVAYLMAVVLH